MAIAVRGDVFAHKHPPAIRQAQARAALLPDLWKSPHLRLVQVLIAFTPLQRVRDPLVFERATPARVLEVTVRTIDRALSVLASLGYVTRLKQERLGPGKWSCCRVRWTDRAIATFFPETTDGQGAISNARVDDKSPSSSHRATSTSHKSEALSPTGKSKPKSTTCAVSPSNTNTQRRLPVDLAASAQRLQLKRPSVCVLMAACKRIGQRLQDVLALREAHLLQQGISGNRAFHYLRACISSGNDFAWLAKRSAAEQAKAAEGDQRRKLAEAVAAKLAANRHSLPNGWIATGSDGYVQIVAPDRKAVLPASQLAQMLVGEHLEWCRALLSNKVQPIAPAQRPSREHVPAQSTPRTRSAMPDAARESLRRLSKSLQRKVATVPRGATR